MMTLGRIKSELLTMVDDLGLSGAEVEAEQAGRWIHVLIASEGFQGKSSSERENMVWREFERRFDDETILSITQCYLMTPRERKGALTA